MEKIAAQTFNRNGKTIDSSYNFSNNCLKPNELTAKLSDKYYRQLNQYPSSENSYRLGFGPFVAITETIAAMSLVWCFHSIATGINLLTTLGEFGQAWVGGLDPNKILESHSKDQKSSAGESRDPMDDQEKKKIVQEAIASKESGMAWFQFFAGGGGILGMLWEYLSGKSEENVDAVPFFKKAVLSASSAMNVFFMLAGAAEKSLMSMLSWNGGGKGQDYRSMIINGDSDMRGAVEWGIMTVVPWISNISSIKKFVDAAVVYGAMREGLEYFSEARNINLTINKKKLVDIDLNKKPVLSKLIQYFVNPFSLITKPPESEDEGLRYNLCWPFNKALGFLLGYENDVGGAGSSGFRSKVIAPLLKNVFGCNPFNAYLDSKKNIVCEFIEEEPIGQIPKTVNIQPKDKDKLPDPYMPPVRAVVAASGN